MLILIFFLNRFLPFGRGNEFLLLCVKRVVNSATLVNCRSNLFCLPFPSGLLSAWRDSNRLGHVIDNGPNSPITTACSILCTHMFY